MTNLPLILLVNESPGDRRLAVLVLKEAFGDVEIEEVGSAADFSVALAARRFGLVITDTEFSWGDGLEITRLVREALPACPVVFFTGRVDAELWSESLRLRVDGCVEKSSDGFIRLPEAVRSAYYRTRRQVLANSRDTPYRRQIERLPVGVFSATPGGEILEANPAFAAMLGLFDPEEVSWSNFPGLFVDPAVAEDWRSQMASARYVGNLETRLRRADSSKLWARISSWVVEDEGAGVRYVQGIVEETSAHHASREELEHRIEMLERSNDELEQFAYVVSHDLQQPLSVVSSYLELLGDSCRERLGDEEESYLDRAAGATVKVQEMVDAVLNYARVDSRGREFSSVDLNETIESVKGLLWKEITCAKAEITVGDLPVVEADPSQMEQLLHNLLSNAVKFADGGPARVEIGCEELEDSFRCSVRDEGIGLDPDASDRVFVMFQRLHTTEEYPGSGIGLAICKRIVERHGGRIWFESEPGSGATFYFTIPKRSFGGGDVKP